MVPWRATEDGFVTDDVLDWYGRFADGRPGALVVEATGIRDVPSGPLLRIGHDRFVPGLRRSPSGARRERRAPDAAAHPADRLPRGQAAPARADKFFARFLAVTRRHRERLARARRSALRTRDDAERARGLLAADDDALRGRS
jgi:hypothetical protein